MNDENAVIPKSDSAVAQSTPATSLRAALDEETERRKIMTEFISKHLVDGVDYGRIHIGRGCTDKKRCKDPEHFSKKCLYKPGAEKFCSLLHLTPKFRRDDETLAMLPANMREEIGALALICELHDKSGNIVSEGRGICSVAEKGGALNTAIKIAEKRALVDSVLRAFSISDAFTQDEIEDVEKGIKIRPGDSADEPIDEPTKAQRKEAAELAKDAAKRLRWGKAKVEEFARHYLKTNRPMDKMSRLEQYRVFNALIDTANEAKK
jgi:hypothetical protein